MARQIQILLVENELEDARLIMDEVSRGIFDSLFTHVSGRQGVLGALEQKWDLVISDFALVDMTALDLLEWLGQRQLDVPVILVAGNVDEELVVRSMRAGARDFINKSSLARLNPAIERELQEQDIHQQRWLAEAALVESEQNFRQLTENIPEVFWLIDCKQQQMIYLSPAFERIWEQHPAQFMSQPMRLLETVHPEDHDRVSEQLLENGWGEFTIKYRIVLPDGSVRWVHTRSFPIRDEQGRLFRIAGLSNDISERMRLEQEREMMSRALEQSADAVMITDAEGDIVYVNPAFEDLTGYASSEMLGNNPSMLKSGFQDRTFYTSLWSNISQGIPYTDIFINRRKNGELYYEAKTITPIRDQEGVVSHFVSTGKDITERLKTRERLNSLVNYDAVTGLANQVLLQDRLNQAVLHSRRLRRVFGLLCVGMELNELLGKEHDNKVMEQVLREVAQRIHNCVDTDDTIARIENGDFMVLHKENEQAREQLESLAKNLILAFASPIITEGYELFVSPAIGISLCPDDAGEAGQLLEHAKVAMEHARKVGHGGYSFFQGGMLPQAKHLSS